MNSNPKTKRSGPIGIPTEGRIRRRSDYQNIANDKAVTGSVKDFSDKNIVAYGASLELAKTDNLLVTRDLIAPSANKGLFLHDKLELVVFVKSGSCIIHIKEKNNSNLLQNSVQLNVGNCYTIPKGMVYSIEATNEGCDCLFISHVDYNVKLKKLRESSRVNFKLPKQDENRVVGSRRTREQTQVASENYVKSVSEAHSQKRNIVKTASERQLVKEDAEFDRLMQESDNAIQDHLKEIEAQKAKESQNINASEN